MFQIHGVSKRQNLLIVADVLIGVIQILDSFKMGQSVAFVAILASITIQKRTPRKKYFRNFFVTLSNNNEQLEFAIRRFKENFTNFSDSPLPNEIGKTATVIGNKAPEQIRKKIILIIIKIYSK